MSQNLTVEVTQEDITTGECGNAYRCAIAVALKRITGPESVVMVGASMASVATTLLEWELGRIVDYRLPKEACDFILAFDHKLEVEPFTFTAELSRAL